MNVPPAEPRVIIAWVLFVGVSMLLLWWYARVHALGIPLVSFLMAGLIWVGIICLVYICHQLAYGHAPAGPFTVFLRAMQLKIRGY
jgi:hypothetical protein